MRISSVRFTQNGDVKASTFEGNTYTIPAGSTTTHAREVEAWVAAGNTITPAPTEAELLDDKRNAAKAALDAAGFEILRAIVLESLAYANAQREAFNRLIQWLGTQTALAQRSQLAELGLPLATPDQAKTRIKGRIGAGEVD